MKRKPILMLFFSLLICLFSCIGNEQEDHAMEKSKDVEMLMKFLHGHQNSVIELHGFGRPIIADSFSSVKELIDQLDENQKYDGVFEDSLLSSIGLNILKNLKTNSENRKGVFLRMLKGTSAFGYNKYRVIEVNQEGERLIGKDFLIKFDDNFNLPVIDMGQENPFTRKCFSVLDSSVVEIPIESWNKINNEINLTDLTRTTYFYRRGLICDGFVYSLDYSSEIEYPESWVHLTKSCPGEKTGIFLVSEKLIEMIEEIKE